MNASYTRLPDYMDRIDPTRTQLVHCQTGARAAVASSWLARQGVDVRYVNDLFAKWAGTSPLEREDSAVPV